ncbi:hypothetical protein Tco_1432611, partial [Tanacetum coccineum]
FISFYLIPSKYCVILPTSTQTILDAPHGYIGLYTHCFSLANLRFPLNNFFCEVLQYFKVHISRLNPFGYSKLTTFIVMCKAYDCEPSVELFRGFLNLCKAGSWLTFQKRSEKHIPSLLAKVITRIEGWHKRFFFIQDTIVPSKFPQLLLKENMLDRCLSKKFIYIEEDEDLTFLPKDLSLGFNTSSPYMSINTEPVRTDEEPATKLVNKSVGTTTDLGGSPKGDTFVVYAGSVAACIRERKCKTRGGSSRPPVKRKLAYGLLTSRTIRAKASAMKDDTHVLSISDDEDNHFNMDLLDLHDRCYARQAVVDNAVNRRSRELLKVIEKLRGEADVMRARELAREEECEGLQAKCEAVMTDFDKNPVVLLL